MSFVFFSDTLNYKESNFLSLYTHFKKNNYELIYDRGNYDHLKKKWGDLSSLDFEQVINLYSSKENYGYEYKGINLKDVISDELFYSLTNSSEFRKDYFSQDIWPYIEMHHKKTLRDYLSLGMFWIDYWLGCPAIYNASIGITFGGSTVYSKAFLKTLKKNNIPAFVLEHFFTGDDFYCELRYDSLPNNAYFSRPISSQTHWIDKLSQKNNRNVKKQAYKSYNLSGYYLILGQVYNDFSIVSDKNKFKNSICFYKKLILSLLEKTNQSIVFKGHPYESLKVKDGMSTTVEALEFFRLTLPSEYQNRFFIESNYDIAGLIDSSTLCLTLTSQSGLEAIERGKPLITFNGAFYSKKGFTYDYNDIDSFMNDLIKRDGAFVLPISYRSVFNDYMNNVFDNLIGCDEDYKLEMLFESSGLKKKPMLIKKENLGIVKNIVKKQEEVKEKVQEKVQEKAPKPPRDLKRLFNKFKKNPKQFFLDSDNSFFKFIGRKIK